MTYGSRFGQVCGNRGPHCSLEASCEKTAFDTVSQRGLRIRTILDDEGTPIGAQQKLMRDSDVRTAMNHYGSGYEKTKRRANALVAGRLLRESMKVASRITIQY